MGNIAAWFGVARIFVISNTGRVFRIECVALTHLCVFVVDVAGSVAIAVPFVFVCNRLVGKIWNACDTGTGAGVGVGSAHVAGIAYSFEVSASIAVVIVVLFC